MKFILPHQVSLFREIEDPELIDFIDQMAFRHFPKGFTIFQQSESGNEVYAILNGEVEIVGSDHGEYFHAAQLGPGDVFGEFSYFTGQPRSFAAITKTECAIVEIQASWLDRMSERFPAIARQLHRVFQKRILTNLLRSTRLFGSLSGDQIESIAALMEPVEYRTGELLIREGEKAETLFVLKKGNVSISKKSAGQPVVLAQLGPGEILGEMAAITGEARSASAEATSKVEAMVLSGDRFKKLLTEYPTILETIRDIVENRSARTQALLESVLSDTLEGDWKDLGEHSGLSVGTIGIECEWIGEATSHRVKILQMSATRWIAEPMDPKVSVGSATRQMHVVAAKGRLMKEIASLGAIAVSTQSTQEGLILHIQSSGAETALSVLRSAARAKLSGLIFPQYEAQDVMIGVRVHASYEIHGKLRSMSVTHAKVELDSACPVGSVLQIEFAHKGEWLCKVKGLVLSGDPKDAEFQLEYDTSHERNAIESIIRILYPEFQSARAHGYANAKIETPADAKTPLLVRPFRSAGEFIRTYMTSIESGVLRVQDRRKLSDGTAVRVRVSIPTASGVSHSMVEGVVRSSIRGMVVVELSQNNDLAARLRSIFERLSEHEAKATWERRKDELGPGGLPTLSEDLVFQKVVLIALVILNLAVYLYHYLWVARARLS